MRQKPAIVVVGAGAVGAATAAILYDSGLADVSICARGSREERYRREGFLINGRRYFFDVAPAVEAKPADYLIVAVKNYSLEEAIEEMKPYVGPETLIISLLNGVTAVPRLREEFGAAAVPWAMIIAIDAHRHANEIQYTSQGTINCGFEPELDAAYGPKVRKAAEFLRLCGARVVVPEDIMREIWFKFMINVSINQWSALLRTPYRFFTESAHGRILLEKTMKEVIDLSRARGTGLCEEDIPKVMAILRTLSPHGKTSMLQDIEAGRRTEVDAFAGTMVRLSQESGLNAPINEILYHAILGLEQSAERG